MKIGITGIALGISIMILTISIVLGFKQEIISKITGITSHITISNININESNEPNPLKLPADTLKMLKDLGFIKHIQATAIKNGIIKTKTENEGVLLKGVSTDFDFTFFKKYLSEGSLPVYTDTGVSKEILVSKKLAARLNIKTGQKLLAYFITTKKTDDTVFANRGYAELEKRSRAFKVCGIFNTGFAEFDENLAIVDLKQIQKLNYWTNNEVGSYEVFLNDFNTLDKDVETVQEILGYNYRIMPVNEEYSNIFSWLAMVDVNGIIIISLMLMVSGVNMITALLILILERANMIGLVKAMGMSNVSVRKVFFFVSLKLLWRGLLVGNIIGIAIVLLQYFSHLVKLDSNTYYVEYVPVIFNGLYILLLNSGIIICCMLMMFFPTLILTRITPIKTLRFD
ncbi:MAG TPA: ABC transporter permease [Bacteroidia bacterium]|nr:ABC transporter permease [Bacteroidia bacterium]